MRKFSRYLLLLGAFSFSAVTVKSNDLLCELGEVKAKVTYSETSNLGSIELSLVEGNQNNNFFFYNEDGLLINKNHKNNSLKSLASGSYKCIVIGSNGCSTQIFVDII